MTILVGARNGKAVVIGADSQESTQVARRDTQKIFRPQVGLVLAWAGYKDVAQALALSLSENPLDLSQACVNYIATDNLGADQLSIVALKVLRDSIVVAPPGALVGGEPQLAMITASPISGVHELRRHGTSRVPANGGCGADPPGEGGQPPGSNRGALQPSTRAV
jgi:hypothetical protein